MLPVLRREEEAAKAKSCQMRTALVTMLTDVLIYHSLLYGYVSIMLPLYEVH